MNVQEFENEIIQSDESLKKLFAQVLRERFELEIEQTKSRTFELKQKMQEAIAKHDPANKPKQEEF